MTYYKVGVQTPNLARLTCDGMFVKDGDFNLWSEIQLTLRGLPAGAHQLTTYHNATDNLNAATVCPIDVYVNDVLTINDLVPSIRVFKESECARTRLTFSAEAGRDVVIRFKAEESGAQPVKNVYINAVYRNNRRGGRAGVVRCKQVYFQRKIVIREKPQNVLNNVPRLFHFVGWVADF